MLSFPDTLLLYKVYSEQTLDPFHMLPHCCPAATKLGRKIVSSPSRDQKTTGFGAGGTVVGCREQKYPDVCPLLGTAPPLPSSAEAGGSSRRSCERDAVESTCIKSALV